MKWNAVSLKRLLLTSDSGVWGPEDLDDGISVLRSTNMQNDGTIDFSDLALRSIPRLKREAKLLVPGDILLENSGGGPKQPVGRVCYFAGDKRDHIAGNFCRRLRANSDVILPRFLFWSLFFIHSIGETERFQTQTTGIRNLQFRLYAQRELQLPPLSEQRRILETLDQADALRKHARAADAKAARILPALFLRMFGDPATNPMGWPTGRLDKLFNVVGGGTPAKSVSEFWAGDIPWVSPKDMKVDVITDTEDHVTAEAIANSATKLVEQGSVLIVYRSGILAHTFPVCIAGRPLALNQDLKALQSKGEVCNEFIYGWLTTGQKLALSFVKKGATVHNIDGPRFVSLQVPKPPEELQERFASHLRELLCFKRERMRAAKQIERLFSLLLSRAFSGQLTAKWRQAHTKELLAEIREQARLLDLPMPDAKEFTP